MSNMSYCRFENTYADLLDCHENWDDDDLSDIESKYRRLILALCERIVEDYGDDEE